MKPRAQRMLVLMMLSSSLLLNGCYWGWGRGRGGNHHRWSSNAFDGDPRPATAPLAPGARPVGLPQEAAAIAGERRLG